MPTDYKPSLMSAVGTADDPVTAGTATPEIQGEGVTATETPCASETTDGSLHLIINAIEANPPRPGADVEVTLYMPSGVVMGHLEPCWYFDQKLLGYLQTIGVDHNHPTPRQVTCDKHEYVHLSRVTYHWSSGEVDKHDQIRLRLSDVHSWTFGHGELKVREVNW